MAQAPVATDDTLRLGLLISDNTFREAQRGAELAIKQANQQNFLTKKTVKLITRSMEGQWGTGAKQTVDLVFNQKVWAIIGSHDGRNAHLAEQVIAKTQVVYVSAWAGDPTLAQAYVPWFFSMVPNNIQQAQSLYKQVYSDQPPGKVVVISDESYDAENALRFFLEEVKAQNAVEPVKVNYDVLDFDAQKVLAVIKEIAPGTVILFGKPHESRLLLKELQKTSFRGKMFATFETLGEDPAHNFELDDFKGTSLPDPRYWGNSSGKKFMLDFKTEYGQNASPTAAYAYDATWLLLRKMKEAGLDSSLFRELIRKTKDDGLTGTIQFDEIGKRLQEVNWIVIR